VHFDRSKEALKAAKAASVPEPYADALREISTLSLSKFTKCVGWLNRYISLARFATAWQHLREGVSDINSPVYDELISFTYTGPAPEGHTAAEHVAAAKKRLCTLSNVEECGFDRFRDQSPLPMDGYL
jgi:hypothetical protein